MILSNLIELEFKLSAKSEPPAADLKTSISEEPIQDEKQIHKATAGWKVPEQTLDPLFGFLGDNQAMQSKVCNQLLQVTRVANQPSKVSIQVRLPMVCLVQKVALVYAAAAGCLKEERPQLSIESVERLAIFSAQSEFESMLQKQEAASEEETNKDDVKPDYNGPSELAKECYGISHTFRLVLDCGKSTHGDVEAFLKQEVDLVRVFANPCFKMQSSSNLVPLLNLCNLFQQSNRMGEILELEIMCAQSLIAARKYIQAIEKLRKIQTDLLLQKFKCKTFDTQALCIQLEILCADSMNQHSLIAEKMESYSRIIKLSQDFSRCTPVYQNNGFPRCSKQISETQIVERLISFNPVLIQILKTFLFSNLELVKTASLKHIEYIFDNIGCSIGHTQIINTIQALIQTYPKPNGCSFVQKPHHYQLLRGDLLVIESFASVQPQTVRMNLSCQNLPFYDRIYELESNSSRNKSPQTMSDFFSQSESGPDSVQSQAQRIKHDSDQVSVWKLYRQTLTIKQANHHHQNQILNFKNHYNHILESILQLFNSSSQYHLKEIFETILIKTIFVGPYDTIDCLQNQQLASELRIFLIKFADKIATICQGDLMLTASFLSNLVKSIIPTLLVIKEQVELENKVLEQEAQNTELWNTYLLDNQAKRKLDFNQLLKNPSLIISDSVQMACDKLWTTITTKIISNYNLASDQMANICNWIHLNLKFLGQLAQSKDKSQSQHWTPLTSAQQKFLNLNIDLVKDLCKLQQAHIQLLVPRVSEQEKQIKKSKRKRKIIQQVSNLQVHHQVMMFSNNATYPNFGDYANQMNIIPDNITDLDHQNKLVDSINDEFEYQPAEESLHSHLEEQELLLSGERLVHVYNRHKRLDTQDHAGSAHLASQIHENNNRLIKLPSTHIVQAGVFKLVEPLVFWMEYSIRTRDKLPLFRQIWQVLKLITQQCCLPGHKLNVDLVATIFPHLQKVKDVCMNNTPSLDMLHFLQLVLADIKPKMLKHNPALRDFLLGFLEVFCNCLPHYIHDEIFKICEILIGLTKNYLTASHIEKFLQNMVDKYTMKSKAYKSLLKVFLDMAVAISLKKFDKLTQPNRIQAFINQEIIELPNHRQGFEDVNQQPPGEVPLDFIRAQISSTSQQPALSTQIRSNLMVNDPANVIRAPQPLDITSMDDIDNYVYEDQESGTHILDDDGLGNQITHLRESNQAMRQRIDRRMDRNRSLIHHGQLVNSRSQQILGMQAIETRHSQLPNNRDYAQRVEARPQAAQAIHKSLAEFGAELTWKYEAKIESVVTPFDVICNVCLFDNMPPLSTQINSEDYELLEGIFLEKLEILIILFRCLTGGHLKLFERFLRKLDSTNALQRVFDSNEFSQAKVIAFLLDLASFTKDHFQYVKINKYLIWQPQLGYFCQHLGQGVDVQASEYVPPQQLDEPFLPQVEVDRLPDQQKQVVHDSVQTLSLAQLVLIKLISQLVKRIKVINPSHDGDLPHQIFNHLSHSRQGGSGLKEQQKSNPQKQQQILNLMMVLWTYLLPIPSLTNQLISAKLNDTNNQVWLMESSCPHLHRDNLVPKLVEQYLLQLLQNNFICFTNEMEGKEELIEQPEVANFETMTIVRENYFQKGYQTHQAKENFISINQECGSLKYVISLASYGLESFDFLEQILLQTSGVTKQEPQPIQNSFFGSAQRLQQEEQTQVSPWVSHKFLSTKVLTKIIQLSNLESKPEITNQIFQKSMKLIHRLMGKDSQSEDVASALNLLASLCGFTRQVSLMDDHMKQSLQNPLSKEVNCPRQMIQQVFAHNGQKVSIQIWHEVFSIVEGNSRNFTNNEQILKEAASILIQMAAPRDSVFHFLKLAYEQNQAVAVGTRMLFHGLNRLNENPKPVSHQEDDSSVGSSSESDCDSLNSSVGDVDHYGDRAIEVASAANPRPDTQQTLLSTSQLYTSIRPDLHERTVDLTQTRGFQKYVSTYFYADNYSDLHLFAMITYFEDENQVKFSLTKLHEQHFGEGNLQNRNHQSQLFNTIKTNPTAMQLQNGDSLLQSSVFSSGDNTSDLKLHGLWVDRAKQSYANWDANEPVHSLLNANDPKHLDSTFPADLPYPPSQKYHPVFDGFEDQIIQGLNPSAPNKNGGYPQNSLKTKQKYEQIDHDHNKYLIYDRRYDADGNSNTIASQGELNGVQMHLPDDKLRGPNDRTIRNDRSPSDDLGIIDLDNDEDDEDDIFDVDDDKLPILKNIFSKKNRPNNGKSVAIGSRSQGGTMKIRPQIDTLKAQQRQLAFAQKNQYAQGQAKDQQHKQPPSHLQKPNSAQRILKSSNRRRQQVRTKQAIKNSSSNIQIRSNRNREDEDQPVVIYDEDNLIIDEFLTGRQRPQSGRVNRQRPLSGKVDPLDRTHFDSSKRATKEYNNKYQF